MENEELDNIIVLNDEQGNEVNFEFLDLVELDEEEYEDDEEILDSDDINLLKPVEIKEHLDEYVIGQEAAKKVLAVSVYNEAKRIFCVPSL